MEKNKGNFPYSKHLIVALLFTLGMLTFEFFLFPHYYESFRVIKFLQSGMYLQPLKVLALFVPSFLLSFLFFSASVISPYRYRIVYLALFCMSVLTEYGYQNVSSRFSNPEDAANALFAADSRIFYTSASGYFDNRALLPCVAFALLLIFIEPVKAKGLKIFLVTVSLFVGFFTMTAYVSTNIFPTISLNALYRTVIGFPVNWFAGSLTQPALASFYNTPRRTIDFQAANLPKNNIVFIVDESMRGDHLSLNGYARKTSPFLEELNQKGLLKNWGIAVAGTTCSITSNNLLLTGINELPDVSGNVYKFPTIFQYAKAMGYKTFYYDGQTSARWNGKQTDIEDFGEWITPVELQKDNWFEVDAEIARRIKETVENSTGNFIWVNKFGVHPTYFDSYPASETVWLPIPHKSDEFALSQGSRRSEKLINNYDNAILYNSQSFFTNLLGGGLAKNTFYVYTSDHGQNLGEDGKTLSHCSVTKNEANVPLFIAAEPQIMPSADVNFKAAHSNLFATLLDLMEFPESERRLSYSPSLFKTTAADSKPRVYLEGNLTSQYSNGIYLFDE